MRDAVDAQPAIGVGLVVADLPAHALGEHLGAAAGQRVQAGGHQLAQHLLVGHPVEVAEKRDLDRGETLQVNLRPDALEARQQVRVVRKRQVGMQAVDDVDFGQRLVGALAQLVPGLLLRQRVRAGIAGPQPRERAEQARGHADVRGLDADVVVVVGPAGVTPLALAVGQPAKGQQVRRLEQRARRRPASGARTPLACQRGRGDLPPRGGRGRGCQLRIADCRLQIANSRIQGMRGHRSRVAPNLQSASCNQEIPNIWIRSVRARGPSSSAIRMRCHCPSTTSPPLICSVRL